MEDLEPVSREVIKDSVSSSAGFPMSEEGVLPQTVGEPPETSSLESPISVEHGPSPIVTTTPDFSESTSSSVHPFKLERFTDSKGNTRTRVYVGKLRYCINTFDIEIKKDKTGATAYGSLGSTNTGPESGHTHSGTSTVTIPDHEHENGSDETHGGLTIPEHKHLAGSNLTITDHTHAAGSYVGSSGSAITGSSGLTNSSNALDVTGNTGNIKEKSSYDNVEGRTGGIYGSLSPISVTTGSSTGHTHTLPNLSTTTSEADRFVCIKTQGQGAGILKEVEPTGFTALKDSSDKDTVVKTKTLPIGDTYGSIFLRWKLVLSDSDSLDLQTINQADVTIYRHSDPTKTAEQLITDNAEKLTTLRGVDDENNAASGTNMEAFKRGSETEGDRTAYYYVKIGNSYDPNAAGTNSKTIEQITYENVYWSPFLLPRYTGSIS